ncbi:MAG: amidohydrolase family protein [Proteobacteria bacterium]|nr:amidohydrolase family protein [Pseudomonadota bacterium]
MLASSLGGCAIEANGSDNSADTEDEVVFGPKGVDYKGQRLQVIDAHLHTGNWDNLPPHMQELFRNTLPFPLNLVPDWVVNYTLSSYGIAAQLNESGISRGVLMAVYAPQTVGLTTNEFVRDRISELPDRFYGLASVSAQDWEQNKGRALQNLDEHLSLPEFIGVKMAHPHMGLALNDAAFYPIYELAAQHSVPVYIHTGNTPSPGSRTDPEATDPAYLEEAIALHPDTRFVLGHMGYDFLGRTLGHLETCLDLAKRYPNVYLEASALGSERSDPDGVNLRSVLRAVKSEGLVGRLVYGSDGPQSSGFVKSYLTRTLEAMADEGYTVDEARQVLYDNFAALFSVSGK